MRLIVIAKLTDDSDPVNGYVDVLSFVREENVLIDLPDDPEEAGAYSAAIVEGGATILDYLDDAKRKIGDQVGKTERGLERMRRHQEGDGS